MQDDIQENEVPQENISTEKEVIPTPVVEEETVVETTQNIYE